MSDYYEDASGNIYKHSDKAGTVSNPKPQTGPSWYLGKVWSTEMIGGDHYLKSKIQPRDVIRDWDLSWDLGNVVKYIQRHEHKGTPRQDIEKAIHYLQMYLEDLD